MTLSNPTGGARLGSLPSTTVTIIDNDPLPVGGTLQFSSATYSVYEHLLSVDISVTRSGSCDGEVTVTYLTAGRTAVVGPDYFSANGTLTWGNGDTSNRSFTVTLVYDPIEEGDETFLVWLFNPTGGAGLGNPSNATVTISEAPWVLLSFSAETYNATEQDGTVVLSVDRTGRSEGAVSVSYISSDGTATAGSDYTLASGTLDWPNGDTSSKSVTLTILDDSIYEGDETFTLSLGPGNPGTKVVAPQTATVTIVDDDPP